MAKILIVSFVILFSVYLTEQAYFLQKEYINKINEKATTWKAGFNFDPSTSKERIFKMLGSKRIQHAKSADSHMFKTIDIYNQRFARLIPKKFDARKRWRHCKRIGEVRDQGNCDSSWALATSSAFSDRFCIATHGEFNELLSAEELTFCCDACGEGCNGGSPIRAWEYFSTNGLVTGGNYNTSEGCQPYQVSPCPYDKNGNKTCKDKPVEVNHECKTRCFGDEEIEYYDDHKFTRDFYFLTKKTVQLDVLFRGPVEASFEAYDDFPSYKSGIYVKTENAKHIGSLSVKLIGWGEEKGVPYWLTVNSWGKNWGENGFFRIRRGTDECGIESAITGGVPVVD